MECASPGERGGTDVREVKATGTCKSVIVVLPADLSTRPAAAAAAAAAAVDVTHGSCRQLRYLKTLCTRFLQFVSKID